MADSLLPGAVATYTGLTAGTRYVAFNGNGSGKKKAKYHGRGYSLRSWMVRAAYWDSDASPFSDSKRVRQFLADLARVADLFGLVVAAWHPGRKEWQSLEALPGLLRSKSGEQWVEAARLRIYTPADYLTRWRTWFADRMGFSMLPAVADERPAPSGPGRLGGRATAVYRRRKPHPGGVRASRGGVEVGPQPRPSGKLPWTPTWRGQVQTCLAAHPEWQQQV